MNAISGGSSLPLHIIPYQTTLVDVFFPGFSFISASAQKLLAGDMNGFTRFLCACGVIILFARYAISYVSSVVRNHFSPTPPPGAGKLDKQIAKATNKEDGPVACKPRFKKVFEIWDKKILNYKVVESLEPRESTEDNFSGYEFVVRQHIDPFSQKSTIYVDVKSKTLHDLLREVLEKVKAVSVLEPKPSIEQIFLFHFLPELKSKLDQLTHCEQSTNTADPRNPSNGAEHLCLLVDYIEKAYAPTVERLKSLLQRGEITYDLLEFLFKPGCHVYTKCSGTGKSRCVVYNAAEEITRADGTHLRLECYYLDHDGHKIGEAEIELGIVKFRGRKPIHTLEAFPLQHHPDCEKITQDLQKCGRKFSQFVRRCKEDILMQHCRGTAFIMKNGKPLALNINSLVAINPSLFYEMMPNYYCPRVSNCWDQHLITKDECLICCPTIQCFVFNEKRFLECAVGDLREVQWSPASFDRLQIPDDKKEIILRVTDARLSGNKDVEFDDFIKGKGQGLNVLFYGEPGVGKTFTIQAMAERSQRPLYSVSAGELIADHGGPLQLEIALDQIFKIAKGTGSILLFDEADVFMEKRATYQGGQNKLVTIFLRGLESYKGVLFLTTNRVREFDDAVLSRIHLKIQYTTLTQDARRNIWESFLLVAGTPQGPAILEMSELEHLVSMKLNGREIKNISCVAQAIAVAENSHVTFRHLETAVKANDEFVEEFMNSGRMQGMYT